MSEAADTRQETPGLPGVFPPGHPVRQKVKNALVALSFGNLCFITPWFAQLYDTDFGYFNKLPVTRACLLALATNILWMALLAWLVMRALRRFRSPWLHLPCHLMFLSALLLVADFCRVKVFEIADYRVIAFFKQPWAFLGLLVLLVVVVWQHRWAARITAVALGILSPLALFTLLKITLICLGVVHLAQHTSEPAPQAPGPGREGQPRVVWIIFDETDQRLTFDQRPAGVQLPEFDRLRSESIYATNAYAPDDGTLFSMPSLITGRRISKAVIKNASDLTLTYADTGKEVSWSEQPSVFSAARGLGVNTALVGWYHPYSRVLDGALNYCAWYPYPGFESTRALTFGLALRQEIGALRGTLHRKKIFIGLCQESLAQSLSLVTNATYGLILLHLPPPHKPGVYLPSQDRFTILPMTKVTGYFNNLMLADRFLGKLRRALETSGLWDKTWIIQSTDHSWRESRIYDGRRDLRVPFLLKAPGAGQPITYSPQMNTVLTHDLILAILRGELGSQESAVTWLNAHRSEEPTVLGNGQLD